MESCSAQATSTAVPSAMRGGLLPLFACASGLSVANVYYAQPLLDAVAKDFGISHAAIGQVVAVTQVGCALALVLLVPLGDLVNRRHLMLAQALGLAAVLALVSLAGSATSLLAGMLGIGLLGTAMTQGMIAYAAGAASPEERGRVVGITQGGVFTGLLLARVVAGGISDLAGWRGVYLGSATAMLGLTVLLWHRLPFLPVISQRETGYGRLIVSMFRLIGEERVLWIRGVIALLMFAALNIFWSALVLPLSGPPYGFSHTAIGAFGLVGVAGAMAAARAGRLADQGMGQRTSGGALLLLLAAWVPLAFMNSSLWALVPGILLLDLGAQAIHVTNQSMIFRTHTGAHSRLVGGYMLFYAAGSGLGAMATTAAYSHAGWSGVCALGATVSLAALLFWMGTRRLMPE